MPRKKESKNGIKEKLDYLGLDLDNIPKEFKNYKPLKYRITKFYEENQYKQYRYVPVKDIQILLSPTNRLDDVEERFKKSSPLEEYLDNTREENLFKYTTFLNMLNNLDIEEVEIISEEQNKLNKKIPFKVKYEHNYLWQIYYSENTDQYFMIVPTEDTDYSTFFYLLKKQIEKNRGEKVFVPIRNVEYSSKYLKKSEIADIENYLWLFTKDWPLVYEVYDKSSNLTIEIIGETEVYQKIKTFYKKTLKKPEDAIKFYKLLKAMFILQTELPHYFHFTTNLSKTGEIEFYLEGEKIEFDDIAEWLKDEYHIGEDKEKIADELIIENREKLEKLKSEIAIQEIEYLAKEKQISTFLECKKTFLGKFKYYFKYSKKNKKSKIIEKQKLANNEKNKYKKEDDKIDKKNKKRKKNYNLEEILDLYKIIEEKETELKNIVMDLNSLKLKNKNMKKKIENASAFIEEIDRHKKSIFEFWKYSNKDEMKTLPEGEVEEVNIIKKITKIFDYEQDIEQLGKTMDKMQRKILSKDETDSIYISSTSLIELLNKIKTNDYLPKDIENALKGIKTKAIKEKTLYDNEEFDIFGGILQDSTKISKINNKKHRELPKDLFNILEINKNSKQISFKLSLERVIANIKEAITKVVIPENLPVYKAIPEEKIDDRKINIFNLNPENEIMENIDCKSNKLNFYKFNLKEGTNGIAYTNCIFYDNQNKTLPIGLDLSSKILIDINKLNLLLKNKTTFRVLEFENNKDDFSKNNIKTITVYEYETEPKKHDEK